MKKIILLFFSIFVVSTGFAENFVLDIQTVNITNKSKIAIQWANSAKEIEESDNRLRQGMKLNSETLQVIPQKGKINLDIPKKAEYFRVFSWSKDTKTPDLLTSWVDIVPNKNYFLKDEHLVPLVLISGTGC